MVPQLLFYKVNERLIVIVYIYRALYRDHPGLCLNIDNSELCTEPTHIRSKNQEIQAGAEENPQTNHQKL